MSRFPKRKEVPGIFSGNPSYLSLLRTLKVLRLSCLMPASGFSHSYGELFYGSSESPGGIIPEAQRYRAPLCVLPLGPF